LSFVLLVGAGLLIENLHKVRTASPGFLTSEVLDTSVPLVAAGYDGPLGRASDKWTTMSERLRTM